MKLIEMYFWNALYWALYLPSSLIIHLITGQGDILGILIVGLLLTGIFTLILLFQEGVLWDDLEPATILTEEECQEELAKLTGKPAKREEKPSDEQSPAETVEELPVDAPIENLEVNTNAEEEKTRPDHTDSAPDGVEPEPKLRTDVRLDELYAPDDSVVG